MSASLTTQQTIRALSQEGYKYGFVTDIEADTAPPGLSRAIRTPPVSGQAWL